MKLFAGGWALGTLVGGVVLCVKARAGTQLVDCFIWAGLIVGPLAGLAMWGLLP